MHITEDAIIHIELAFKKMREIFQCKSTTAKLRWLIGPFNSYTPILSSDTI